MTNPVSNPTSNFSIKNSLLILLLLLAFCLMAFLESSDYEQALRTSKRTYCDVNTCHEANNRTNATIIYEYERGAK